MKRKRPVKWRVVRGRLENLRGPNRALTLDEQLEIQRLLREAFASRRRTRTAAELAVRYGVSVRTIYRYAQTVAVPVGLERLTLRVKAWSRERDLRLTADDIASLMYLLTRHRDYRGEEAA